MICRQDGSSRDLISQILANGMPPNGPITAPYYAPKCAYCYPILCPQIALFLLHGIYSQMPLLLPHSMAPNGPITAPWHTSEWPHYCPMACPQMAP